MIVGGRNWRCAFFPWCCKNRMRASGFAGLSGFRYAPATGASPVVRFGDALDRDALYSLASVCRVALCCLVGFQRAWTMARLRRIQRLQAFRQGLRCIRFSCSCVRCSAGSMLPSARHCDGLEVVVVLPSVIQFKGDVLDCGWAFHLKDVFGADVEFVGNDFGLPSFS